MKDEEMERLEAMGVRPWHFTHLPWYSKAIVWTLWNIGHVLGLMGEGFERIAQAIRDIRN